jgi:repressor LexA
MTTPNRDPDHLGKLRTYYADTRRIPSTRRLASLLGFSQSAAFKFMERLAKAGLLTRTADDDAWLPTTRFFERPLAEATVQAGNPVATEGVAAEPFLIDEYVVRNPAHTVLIPVKGESMRDAGIHDGDLAVIDRSQAAHPGDFVVAVVDQDYTLKELVQERGCYLLKPHNPDFEVIRPKGELEIFGVLVGLVRRYRG